jgi:hypothetical protein
MFINNIKYIYIYLINFYIIYYLLYYFLCGLDVFNLDKDDDVELLLSVLF